MGAVSVFIRQSQKLGLLEGGLLGSRMTGD